MQQDFDRVVLGEETAARAWTELGWVTFSSGYCPVFCSFLVAASTVTVHRSLFP